MNPILVDIFRNDTRESFHRGSVVAVNAEGEVIFSLGDISAMVFPRSAIKPVQAIPLIESGAAAHFNLSNEALALACASHNAEQAHQAVLTDWMQKVGLDESMLACGPSLPLHQGTAHQLLRDGGDAQRRLHNCSGKHTGMLTLAKYLNVSLQDYSQYEHETQQHWMQVLTDLTGINVATLPWDRDGCGLPALAMPLQDFARALAGFCRLKGDDSARARAMRTVLDVMHAHPQMVAGSERCCTATMQAHSDLVVKTGAEGVFAAIAPGDGIAIALKIDDGATRAADAALGAVLRHLNIISSDAYHALQQWYAPDILNSQGVVVGRLAASAVWQSDI